MRPFSVIPESPEALVSANGTASTPDGRLLLLLPPAGNCDLLISRTDPPVTMEDFESCLNLFGKTGVLQQTLPESAGIEVAGDRFVVSWSTGNTLHCATTLFPLRPGSEWARSSLDFEGKTVVEQILAPRADTAAILYHETRPDPARSSLGVALRADGTLRAIRLRESADGLYSPRGCYLADGSLEVTWTRSELYPTIEYTRIKSVNEPAEIRTLHEGTNADLLAREGKLFVTSEQEDETIRVDLMKDGNLIDSHRLAGKGCLRPCLKTDIHGVVWLFANDVDQRQLTYRRFLGHGFSPEAQCAGAPGKWWMSMERSISLHTTGAEAGWAVLGSEYLSEDRLLTSGPRQYRTCFDFLPVPRLSVDDSRHVLFLDLLEVAEMENLDRQVATAVRSEANPLKLNGPPGSHDAAWVDYATVLHESGKFRMWYCCNTDDFERTWNLCYAESDDGVEWRKPELNLVEYKGSGKNNLLLPPEYNAAVPIVFRDDEENDRSRRYKMIFTAEDKGGPDWYLTHSDDGIHWEMPPKRLWGRTPGPNQVVHGFNPWIEPLLSLFKDPLTTHPDFKWKIYGQDRWAAHPHEVSPKTRNLSMAHGPDPTRLKGYHGNPLLDPRTGSNEDQIHGGLVQPYEGLYLCLYQHWKGDDWEVDLRLAASRDGIHFARIQPEVPVLPLAPRGAWDSGMLCTPASFFTHDGKIQLYYRGSVGTLATGRILFSAADSSQLQKHEYWRMMTGLAHLRQDGFAFVTLARPRQHAQPLKYMDVPKYRTPMRGLLKTIPINCSGLNGHKLHVNIENFAPEAAYLSVQISDAASGEPLPGYRFSDCDSIGQSSIDQVVTWKENSSLEEISSGSMRLEFQLYGAQDSPQLYSFWFDQK
jgi:hypothetical protein